MNGLLLSPVYFLLVVLPSGQASPTPAGDVSSALPCASCALADRRNASAPPAEQTDMVEAVKRHILSMLHLSARPNLTHPVPRAALLNALKKLHVEVQEEEQEPQPPSEIITFAEPGASSATVTFDLSKEGTSSSMVDQANVWIFLKLAKGTRAKGKVNLRLLLQTGPPGRAKDEQPVSEKMIDAHRSGWHSLPMPHAVQALLGRGESLLNLRVLCPLCGEAGAVPILVPAEGAKDREQSHRPFLMVGLRAGEDAPHRRAKRGLECDGKVRACCKRQFYVNFKDIGWNDWIIAPSGYHANYCEGDCTGHAANVPGSSLSFHSTVISHYRMRGYAAFQNAKSCCVPTRLRAMSMLYYNEEQKIIKKDIQNMIVEECGCS